MNKKTMILAIIGVAAVALLMGTDKGKKLRKKMRKKGMDVADMVKDRVKDKMNRYAESKV